MQPSCRRRFLTWQVNRRNRLIFVVRQEIIVTQSELLNPEFFDWMSATEYPDESWPGPGPKLSTLRTWVDTLVSDGRHTIVAATYAAAKTACDYWDTWLAAQQQIIHEGFTPTKHLEAVERWLSDPTDSNKASAYDTLNVYNQLSWICEEFRPVWFDKPGQWAVESSEFCVLSLTDDSISTACQSLNGTLSILCAINAFRKRDGDDLRVPLGTVLTAILGQFVEPENPT